MNGIAFGNLVGARAAKLAELSITVEDLNELSAHADRLAREFEILDEEVKLARAVWESKIKKPVVFTGIEVINGRKL